MTRSCDIVLTRLPGRNQVVKQPSPLSGGASSRRKAWRITTFATLPAKQRETILTDLAVRDRYHPELEAEIARLLGQGPGAGWLSFVLDPASHSPVLFFHYPAALPSGTYIAPMVKMEFGSLTDQRPTGRHAVRAMIENAVPGVFDDTGAEVVALEVERTFWEKATILHAEYHRPAGKPIPARFARHYADFAALWCHSAGQAAAQRFDLLDRVRRHKRRFFTSAWAHYESAVPGTLRLAPPEHRLAELRRDYLLMEPMFLAPPPSFDEVIQTLRNAEASLNKARVMEK